MAGAGTCLYFAHAKFLCNAKIAEMLIAAENRKRTAFSQRAGIVGGRPAYGKCETVEGAKLPALSPFRLAGSGQARR
jgi:hypothetical protein